MRRAQYTASDGRVFVTAIPEAAPDTHADIGVPIGPPDLSTLKLPDDWTVRLQNALVAHGILTYEDYRRNPMAVRGAINSAMREQLRELEAIYRRRAEG